MRKSPCRWTTNADKVELFSGEGQLAQAFRDCGLQALCPRLVAASLLWHGKAKRFKCTCVAPTFMTKID